MVGVRAFKLSSELLLRWTYPILFIAPFVMMVSLLFDSLPRPVDYLARTVGMGSALTLIALVISLRSSYYSDLQEDTVARPVSTE